MKRHYQSVIVLVLSASLAGCLTRKDPLPAVQPFAEGPWGRTVQTPPPSQMPQLETAPERVSVKIPRSEPIAKKDSGFRLFNRKPKPAPAPDAAEQPQVERITGDRTAAEAATEQEKKIGFLRRKSGVKADTPFAPRPLPELEPGPIVKNRAISDEAAAPQPEKEKRFGFFRRNRESIAEAKPKSITAPERVPAPNRELERELQVETDPIVVDRSVSFVNDVKPIFQEKCVGCHNRDTLHGRVSLESRELAFQNGPAGAFIVPGDPEASILFQNIVTSKTSENAMPPVGHRVTRQEKNTLYAWIMEGAVWPTGSAGRIVADATPRE